MKYVVIGGAGFIGSHMVDLLGIHGDVIIIDNLSTGRIENVPNQDLFRYDICNMPDLCKNFLLDADYVFHFAAKARVQPSIKDPVGFNDTNVNGLLYVLDVLRHSTKLKKFVFSSSSSVYGDAGIYPTPEDAPKKPSSPYALQKLIGEYYVKMYADLYGLPTASLRYFNVFGNRMTVGGSYSLVMGIWVDLIKNGKPITINGDGGQSRDFTFVEDVVKANLMVALDDKIHSGEAFNIGGGNPISVNEIAQIFQHTTNCDMIYLPSVIEPYVTHAGIRLAKKTFDWSPTIRLEDWLPIYIEREL